MLHISNNFFFFQLYLSETRIPLTNHRRQSVLRIRIRSDAFWPWIPYLYFWELNDKSSIIIGKLAQIFSSTVQKKGIFYFVIFMATKKVGQQIFSTLSSVAVFGSGIRDGKNKDPGCYSGSATLTSMQIFTMKSDLELARDVQLKSDECFGGDAGLRALGSQPIRRNNLRVGRLPAWNRNHPVIKVYGMLGVSHTLQ